MERLKLMDEIRQREILSAVKEAVELAPETGPTRALAKVAEQRGYNRNVLQRMVEVYNTGRTLHQLRSSPPEKRADSFELADYEQACHLLYPDGPEVKSAFFTDEPDQKFESSIPNFHTAPLRMSKVAEQLSAVSKQPDRPANAVTAWRLLEQYRTRARRCEKEASEYRLLLEESLREVGRNFCLADQAAGWPRWRKEAEAINGPLAVQLCQLVEDQHGLASRLSRHKLAVEAELPRVINDRTVPHRLMEVACKAAELTAQRYRTARSWRDRWSSLRAELSALGKTSAEKGGSDVVTFLSGKHLSDQLSGMAHELTNQGEAPKVNRIDVENEMNISDELRKARVNLAVRDLMEEDEIISQHSQKDPAKVLEAVSQVSRISPALLDMPLALRTAVRRQLEMGVTEPFELQQLRDFSKKPHEYQAPGMGMVFSTVPPKSSE